MTNDTLKSLGYLKKSLKMSKRAVTKNMGDDKTSQNDVDILTGTIDDLLSVIETFETKGATIPAVPSVPDGVAQPAPAASTVSVVPLDSDVFLPDVFDDATTATTDTTTTDPK
jgi:hypothetical protein